MNIYYVWTSVCASRCSLKKYNVKTERQTYWQRQRQRKRETQIEAVRRWVLGGWVNMSGCTYACGGAVNSRLQFLRVRETKLFLSSPPGIRPVRWPWNCCSCNFNKFRHVNDHSPCASVSHALKAPSFLPDSSWIRNPRRTSLQPGEIYIICTKVDKHGEVQSSPDSEKARKKRRRERKPRRGRPRECSSREFYGGGWAWGLGGGTPEPCFSESEFFVHFLCALSAPLAFDFDYIIAINMHAYVRTQACLQTDRYE